MSFRALQYRNFRLFWVGQIGSLSGTWMQIVAQSWLVYRLTSSPFALGVVNFVSLIPMIPLTFIGGSLADRFSKRDLLIFTNINGMVQAFGLAYLSWSGNIELWHIMAFSALLGAGNMLETGSRQAFIADLIPDDTLTSAIALSTSSWNIARIVGPTIAGYILASTGESFAFLINGVTYLIAILSLLTIRVEQTEASRKKISVIEDYKELGRYFWQTPGALKIMAIIAISAFFTLSFPPLMPVFVVEVYSAGPQLYGWLMGAIGIGAVLGALGVASIDKVFNRVRLFYLGAIFSPIFLFIFALSRQIVYSWIILALFGVVLIGQNVLGNTILQSSTPEHLRGRMMSIYGLSFTGMTRFGTLALGALAEYIGGPAAIIIAATICISTCGLILIKSRHLFLSHSHNLSDP